MNNFIRQARPPKDEEVLSVISESSPGFLQNLNSSFDFSEYYSLFSDWISASKNVYFKDTGEYTPYFSSGVTQAFHNFYMQFHKKKLFLLKGEYPYHRDVWSSFQWSFEWYVEGVVRDDAFLILSIPFSGSGSVEPNHRSILVECERRGIPVMIDFAFLGLGTEVDVNDFIKYKCVQQFAFSFSKMFNLGKIRSGICWQRNSSGPLKILNDWSYLNKPGIYYSRKMMNEFGFDYMANKYRPKQLEICSSYGLDPSSSYIFGIGDSRYESFSRDQVYNRVCISPHLEL